LLTLFLLLLNVTNTLWFPSIWLFATSKNYILQPTQDSGQSHFIMQQSKAIIITGAGGSLGSQIALALELKFPKVYHLILTARSLTASTTKKTTANLITAGVEFSWEMVDLSSLDDVKALIARIKLRFNSGDLGTTRLAGLIHSAALQLNTRGQRTADGFDPVYQINVLASSLLTLDLLPLMETGSVVVNIVSSTHKMGAVDYFWDDKTGNQGKDWVEQEREQSLGLAGGLARYGSSKLLATMLGFHLQTFLDTVSLTRDLIYESCSDTHLTDSLAELPREACSDRVS
jgi:NAD(P)-dependent dehydrogenase (short-subunit alcohol dehydrogenase family)